MSKQQTKRKAPESQHEGFESEPPRSVSRLAGTPEPQPDIDESKNAMFVFTF